MAQNTFGRNITFPIYNADGTAFHGLELKKATVDSVVMSLGDKVTGDVYYIDNTLAVTMQEYIVVNSVKYTLVSPPTIVREGMVADNTQLKGMTKYSFTFYHPMYQLGNIPFTDIAVTQDEEKYFSQNKTFSWIGNLFEFVQKLRANLKNTQWAIDVEIPQYEQGGSTTTTQWQKATKISDVLSFDKVFVSDALKTAYDTWEIPFVISYYESVLPSGYTRLKWVRISEIHQSVTNTTAPFWLFIYNLNSVSANNKKIHYCKVFNEDTLLFDLIPCKDSNNNVGLFDVVEGVFYGSNQEVTFVAGGEIGENKKFNITFGLPINKIYDQDGNEYVFRFGKGLGLKNNSRTPRNNKIITRIVGYGSDRNVPYGYPQIPWTGNQSWDYTINNNPNAANSYPIYDGIVGGQRVRLIKHPFTRTTLMPSIYSETVNKKVNPNATGYDPDIEIKDYYDAIDDATHAYPNNINLLAPSVEVHQFEKEYPQLGEAAIISATPYDEDGEYYTYTQWYNYLQTRIATMHGQGIDGWQMQLIVSMRDNTCHYTPATAESLPSASIPAGHWEWRTGQATATLDSVIKGNFVYVTLVSSWYNETHKILQIHADPTPVWDDTMNDDGEYIQSYFKIKLPQLTFDIYACAAVTQEMNINMRSGSCMGCTFPVQVNWELYKANFYDSNGNFAPDGAQRDLEKFPKSNLGSIDVIVQKDNDTFGTLMPNQYRYPVNGDKFVILGISLPTSYITTAEQSLDEAMKEYMLENNVHYFDYPLKFDEHFLATHQNILAQIKNNNIVKFQYAGAQMSLYIKQITIKYGDKPLPQYDITLTDDVEIVLNQIGQVTDDVSRMRVQVSELQKYYSENLIQEINNKLSKVVDDVCQGRITFQQGLDVLGSVIFHDKIQSPQFEEGLYTGRGWRIDNLGNAEFESARVRSFLEIVELIVNRLQAQEGDTLFTDNDQIEKVDVIENETDHSISYILTLKEKYQGYVTGQMYGNVVKGIINTLAAKQAGVSDYESASVEVDGENKYYTSWMRVIGTHNTNINLGVNQIQVVLYSDDYYDDGHQGDPEYLHHFTPAGKNFTPCELMTIARWGCVDYSDPEDPDYETIKASIIRRQRMFMISTTDGRVVKYTGVDSPILKNGNYGVTIGELPEFVKNYPSVRSILNQVGEHTDWLYAQGIVVGNLIKVDIEGRPEVNIVDCGNWVNGSNMANPTPRNGIYLYDEWNNTTQQYETHDVWHNNAKWRCLQHQPVVIGGVSTYYEPTDANSVYWLKLEYGVDSLIQEVLPSLNNISFARTAAGGLTPSSRDLSLSIKKTKGGITSTQSISDSGLTIRWSSSSMPESKNTGNEWGNGTATGLSWNNITMQIANTVAATNIYIAAFNSEGTLVDLKTIPIIKDGANGTSPYFADLNNEMDAIQCKHDGSVIADQTVSTVISMWKGSSVEAFVIDNIYRNGTQLMWDGNNNGVWPRVNGSTVSLEFTTSASIADIDDFKITIHSYNDNTVTRELHFTINGVRANAIYRLVPSCSQIVKKKDGTYVPSENVTCSVEKTENGSTSTPSSSEYTLEKSVNGGTYELYSVTSPSSITSDLKFRLTVGGVVVDLETIPLVSDGDKGDTGDSAPTAFASPSQISIPCYSNGNVKAQKITSVIFSLKVGTNTATVTSCVDGTKPIGVTVRGQSNNSVTITVGTSATVSGLSAGVTFTITGTYDGKTYSATVTVALIGATQGEQGEQGNPGSPGDTGPRGKIGRFFYYAGAWNDFASTDSFLVNDAQAPYFAYNSNYWVFNPEINGTYTKQDMGTPSSSSSNWELMTSDFKYIITEAIFGSYAHFGSAIINGDYLMSQYGYMLGFCNTKTPINDSTQYQNVDMDDVLGDDDMYDPTKLIWNDSNLREITSTTYTTITSASFVQNRYYTLEIDENTEVSGNEMLWTIVSQSGTEIASGTIISTATGTNKNCINFKSTVSTTCYLRVKITNQNDTVDINGFYLRFAKFIPYLAMDLLAGKFVANNIIARGELHADSLYHTMMYGNSNDDRFTINDESIVNLGTKAVGTTVILPSTSSCKGRVIELFNHATRFYTTWVGALSTSTFSAAYGSGLGLRVIDSITYKYIKFYCDGTNWWILRAEG